MHTQRHRRCSGRHARDQSDRTDRSDAERARGLAFARRWQNLPQRRRNMEFIFVGQTAIKPYDGNDGCPPGRRDLTEVRCPPTESESHLPGRFTSCAREPLAPHGPRRLKHSRRGPSPFLDPVRAFVRRVAASVDGLVAAWSCLTSLEDFTRRRLRDGASVRPNTVITPELTAARRPPDRRDRTDRTDDS